MLPYKNKDLIEGGIDESGRGCLAGRVYAAVVIPPLKGFSPLLNSQIKDSKKLSRTTRAKLKKLIEKEALDFGIGYCDPDEVDVMNILNATYEAMHRAIDFLKVEPQHLLIDGNRFKSQIVDTWGHDIPHECIVKGDNIYISIAAASILAKEEHDEHIISLLNEDETLKLYDWNNNMCYPTKTHLEALKIYGITKYHRKTFGPCSIYL